MLVTKTEIVGVDPALEEQAYAYIPVDIRANSRINLFIYNLANAKKGRYRTEKIRNVGEPPHVLDSALVDFSTQQINRYLRSNGYFNASVRSEIVADGKRAHVVFHATPGEPFTLRNVAVSIADSTLSEMYREGKGGVGKIRPGMRYDEDSLVVEREQIYNLMRQTGYHDYLRQYMRVDVDTALQRNQADLKLIVDNPAGKTAHTQYFIDSSFIILRHDQPERNL